MTETRIISGKEADKIRGGSQERRKSLLALLDGKVVQVPDQHRPFNASRLRKRGFLLRSRADGNGGRYWWIEQL